MTVRGVVENLSRSKALVLLRYTLIIAMAYLVLVEHGFSSTPRELILLIVAALASNVLVAQLPPRITESTVFYAGIILGDTLWISAALVYSGLFGAEFFYLYFFVLLLAGIGENVGLIAVGATVVCIAYLVVLSTTSGSASLWSTRLLIRIPFLITAAAFYGYLVDRVRRERQRAREEAETVARLEEVQKELSEHAQQLERANEELGREISERERAEQALKGAKDYAESLIDSSLDMIVSTDVNRNIVEFNQAAEDAFGYSKAEIMGTPIDVLYEEPSESLRIRTNLRDDGSFAGEIRNKRKNGESFYVYLSASAIRDAHGKVVGGVGVSRDISEGKRAEEALRESEERYRKLVELSPDAIIVHSEGKIAYVNTAAATLLGAANSEQLIGTPVTAIVHPDYREIVMDRIQDRLNEGTILPLTEEKITRLDGTEVDVEVTAAPITYHQKLSVQAVIRDISERKRAEETVRSIVEGTATVVGKDFFRSLVKHLSTTLQVSFAFISELVDQEGKRLRTLSFWSGKDFGENLEYDTKDTPCENVIIGKGLAFYSEGVQKLFPEDRWLKDAGVESYLGIPFFDSSGKVIGHMGVMDDKPLVEESSLKSILSIFAARAGVELERKRAEEALHAQTRELAAQTKRLEGLIRTSAKVTGTLQAEEVLGGIAEEAAKLLEVDGAGFRLLEGDRLVVGGRYGIAHHVMLNPSIRLGESLSGLVAQEGCPISVPDLREDQFYLAEHKAAAVAHGILAYLGVPLRYRDRIIGVLNLYGKERRTFQQREVDLLQAFADQAAIALENARLFEDIVKGKREWESTFDAIADGIVLLDERGTVVRANRAFGSWWQTHIEVLIGTSWHDLWDQLSLSSACPHCEVWRTKQPVFNEAHLPASNRALALAAFPLQPRDACPTESFIGTILVIRDITERKRAEEELQATQLQLMQSAKLESVGRLGAGIAHEVKNPLAIILQGLAYLSHTQITANDDNVTLVLEKMDNAVKRADRVIGGLLDFSAQRAGDVRPAEVNAVLEQSLLLVHHELVKAHVTVVKKLGQDLPLLLLDRQRIEQVFVNLFINAIQAMTEGGTLTVNTNAKQPTELSPRDGRRQTDPLRGEKTLVVIEVEDTGTGIPDEKLDRVFDPFFTTKPTGQGTGLGLTVTRKIVELHGGMIEVRNRKEGGVRVTLTFNTDEGFGGTEKEVSAKMTGGAQHG